ncbi:hypothetical protein CBR_g25976 [Chara braunii]|uniref:Reverse transcriptase domain-containing protein n=1 Tax=Chara braunii TaxID=69332 RepID=A0A388L6U5_CHABU|nr:hypothetical protein CBR_g25976 [Chara braunii]|eukprot:GBG78041.1 hypothetical protein CBR_g25976 [Chara braunii]
MAREKERIKKEEEEKPKEVEEEEDEGPPLERRRGHHSGNMDDEMEKQISEWVANLSLGEEEEVTMYIPKDDQEAALKKWEAERDVLKRQAMEDEQRMEWKLAMMREKKRRVEAASEAVKELEEVQKLSLKLTPQVDLERKVEILAQSVERLAKIQEQQYEFSRSQDIAVRSMQMGFRDFARELIGAEVNHRLEKTERFCVGAIEGVKVAAPKEEEPCPPHRELVKVKFPDSYSGNREENFDNWEANAYFRLEKDRKVEKILHSLTLLVEDSLPFDIVLGMDWGEAAGATLHLKEHECRLPSSSGEAQTARLFHVSGVENSLAHCCLSAPVFARLVKREKLEEQVFVAYVRPVTEPTEERPMDPAIAKLLEEFRDLTEPPTGTVPQPIQHRIEIEPGSRTPKGAVYRMSPRELEELRKQLDELLEKGWIRPSSSPFGAPVLFVPKKEGELRMCIDYRGLNAITVKNAEPLPRIDDLLDRVQGAKYFSKVDLKSGYHQIEVHPDDQYKTAFRTRYGHYEFIVMPFGLTNAPATFQRCMNDLLRPWLDRFVVVYLDDILVFSRTLEEHQGHLRQVLEKLREANFKINAKKCDWAKTQVLYLGHVLDGDDVKPEDSKIAAIRDWPTPRTLTELRSFLGLANYYWKPVEFMSARMPSEKVATSTYERELYALRQALDHWKHYLLGRHFKVYSDHETLRWLKTHAKMTPKLTRWAAEIDQYDFELKPVKGKYNVVADALSRRADYFGAIVHYLDIGKDLQQRVKEEYAQDPIYSDRLKKVKEAPETEPNYRTTKGLLFEKTNVFDRLCISIA